MLFIGRYRLYHRGKFADEVKKPHSAETSGIVKLSHHDI